jgi:hypothetical protein
VRSTIPVGGGRSVRSFGGSGNTRNTRNMKTLALGILCLLLNKADASIVTITFTNAPGPSTNNILEIQSTEIMRVQSYASSEATSVYFVKNGVEFPLAGNTVVAGPTTLKIVTVADWRNLPQTAYVTVEVAPETFPPDKTVIIPQGTGARIALECSTNLLSWSEIWTNTFTNVPSHKFFRITAARIP